jgi:hypothetical protein
LALALDLDLALGGAGALALALAGALAGTGTLSLAFAGALGGALAFAFAGAGAGAGTGNIVLVCTGIGLGIWHSKKVDNRIIKLFAFLSFPLFCWFTLVAYSSTTALLRFLPWQNVALTWFVVIATCTALWFRGQYLDYQSRNPLQDLIPNPKESQGISLKKSKKKLLYE